jgi:hypothetical protein
MKKLLVYAGLFLSGCSKYPVQNVAIVHDYIVVEGERECSNHSGLHYVVSITTIYGNGDDYPCSDLFRFRCQDGTLIPFNSGATHCFISQGQLDDTLKGKDVSNEYK